MSNRVTTSSRTSCHGAPLLALAGILIGTLSAFAAEPAAKSRIELKQDDARGQLQVLIDGQEALVYQFGTDQDVAHYYPVRSPTGKLLTVQQTDPYPHHRSFWFADFVQLEGQAKTNFYMAFTSRVDKKNPQSPYREQIRHVKFLAQDVTPSAATVKMELVWVADTGKLPVVDETRELRIVPLGRGEYFLDCRFTVTAAYGNLTFCSDPTHYAWPYIRMHPQFAVEPMRLDKAKGETAKEKTTAEKGPGTITNSAGGINGKGTLMQLARWVDYSGTVDGATEGLTIFTDPAEPAPKFFTRDYGTFGPRRPDAQSGKPFELKKGESLRQRIGVLVHAGDVQAGRVAERYQQFAAGKL